jgi:hypothetical protein
VVTPLWWETAADLIWPQSVITYGRMRHDPQLNAVLSAYIHPLMRATWALDPTGCRAEVVKRVADDLGMGILGDDAQPGPARRRGVVWSRHLRQALHHLSFGHMIFERRYEQQPDGYMSLASLGQRMPWTVARMNIGHDGLINSIVQTTQPEPLDARRLVWYVSAQEGANWAGISILRPAFGAWLLKHETWRTHATSIRRFGMGVPYVEAPQGATQAQVQQARQLAASMRAGDQAGIGIPAGFKPMLMGITGSVPDALAFMNYLDQTMARMVLAQIIDLGNVRTASRALGETFMNLFLLSLQGVADEIAMTATSGHPNMPGIVTDMVDVNWGEDEPAPRIVCTDVGENYQATADAIAALSTAHALTPDQTLEDWVRHTWRMPNRGGPVNPGVIPPGQGGGAQPEPGAPPSEANPAGGGAPPPGGQGGSAPEIPGGGDLPDSVLNDILPNASRRVAARALSKAEVAAGFDAAAHQRDWETALDHLLLAYKTNVISAQRANLTDQVHAAVKAGNPAALALTPPPLGQGPELMMAVMRPLCAQAADEMIREAAAQGVRINPDDVTFDAAKLGRVATARASLAASYIAQAASGRAMQVSAAAQPPLTPPPVPPPAPGAVTPAPGAGEAALTGLTAEEAAQRARQSAEQAAGQAAADAADAVDAFLASLSENSLRDQLGAALTAAQNHGRVSVLAAAPQAAQERVIYKATEVLDKNTCQSCRKEDGTVFDTLADAEAAYPTGGYANCEGFARCRGTVIALWGGQV